MGEIITSDGVEPRYVMKKRLEEQEHQQKPVQKKPRKTKEPIRQEMASPTIAEPVLYQWGIDPRKVLPIEQQILEGLNVTIARQTRQEGDGVKWPTNRNYRLPAYYTDFDPMPLETWFELVYRLENAWNVFCRRYNYNNSIKCWKHEWGDAPASVFAECPPTGFGGDIRYPNGSEKAVYMDKRITSGANHGVEEPIYDYYLRTCIHCGALNVKEGPIKMLFVWGSGNRRLNIEYKRWKKKREMRPEPGIVIRRGL